MDKVAIKTWIINNIPASVPLAQKANWVAIDLLRHLGKMERPLAREIITNYWPELAKEIEDNYPHHWS